MNDLGTVHLVYGRYGEFESLARRALEIEERTPGLEHPRVASSTRGTGIVKTARLC